MRFVRVMIQKVKHVKDIIKFNKITVSKKSTIYLSP